MKKLSVVVFVTILLIQQGAGVWWLKLHQLIVQEQQLKYSKIASSEFEYLVISESDYTTYSLEQGKELEWNGHLYDIVHLKKFNNKIYLKVLDDSKELKIKQHLAIFIRHFSTHEKQIFNDLSQLMLLFYLPAENEYAFSEMLQQAAYSNFFSLSYIEFRKAILSPPPKSNYFNFC
jgi:hypothetical protein